jgi:hypothetical protein
MKIFKKKILLFIQMLNDVYLVLLSIEKDHTTPCLFVVVIALYWKGMAGYGMACLPVVVSS